MAEATEVKAAGEVKSANPFAGWRPYQFYVLGVLLAVSILNYVDRGILGVVQEPLKHELKLDDWQLGILSGPLFAILFSVSGLPVARLAERFNRATILSVALGFWSTMTALCGLSVGYIQLALCRIGVGAGEGGCLPSSHSLLATYFPPKQRGLALSISSAGPALAGIVTPIVGGWIAHEFGWRAAFLAMGIPGIIVAVIVRLTLKDPRVVPKAAEGEASKRSTFLADIVWMMRDPAYRWHWIAAAFTGVGVSSMNAFKFSFLIRSQGLNIKEAGAFFGSTGLIGLAGGIVGGYLADRFARERGRSYPLVSGVGQALTFVCYFIAFTQHDRAVVFAALMMAAFVYNLKNGPEYATVQNIVPDRMRATGSAFFMFGATVVGGGSGPLISGGLSNFLSKQKFGDLAGGFAAACPGGKAAQGASADIVAACASASGEGLRSALMMVCTVYGIAAIFLYICSRYIRINKV